MRATVGIVIPYIAAIVAIGPLAACSSASGSTGALPPAPYFVAHSLDRGIAFNFAPTVDGGSPVTGFIIFDGAGDQVMTLPSDSRDYQILGLTPKRKYTFALAAINANGTGPSVSASVTAATKPGSPTNVVATGATKSAVLTWVPGDDNGDATTSYTIRLYDYPYTILANIKAPAMTATISGLYPGGQTQFQVIQSNHVGDSAPNSMSASNVVTIPPG
jgi:hypothetical protein